MAQSGIALAGFGSDAGSLQRDPGLQPPRSSRVFRLRRPCWAITKEEARDVQPAPLPLPPLRSSPDSCRRALVRALRPLQAALSCAPSPALSLPGLPALLLAADLQDGLPGPPSRSQSQALRAAGLWRRPAPELARARPQPPLPRAQAPQDRAAPAPPESQPARAAAAWLGPPARRARNLREHADAAAAHRAGPDREALALHHLGGIRADPGPPPQDATRQDTLRRAAPQGAAARWLAPRVQTYAWARSGAGRRSADDRNRDGREAQLPLPDPGSVRLSAWNPARNDEEHAQTRRQQPALRDQPDRGDGAGPHGTPAPSVVAGEQEAALPRHRAGTLHRLAQSGAAALQLRRGVAGTSLGVRATADDRGRAALVAPGLEQAQYSPACMDRGV